MIFTERPSAWISLIFPREVPAGLKQSRKQRRKMAKKMNLPAASSGVSKPQGTQQAAGN